MKEGRKIGDEKQKMGGKQIPVGVKIISILYYIGAALGIIFGFLFILGAEFVNSIVRGIPIIGAFRAELFVFPIIGAFRAELFFLEAGIKLISLAILGLFVGRGLWKAKSWARIAAIIFACIGVLAAIGGNTSMIQGTIVSNIFNLLLNGVIGGYLLFSKGVKNAFA